MGIFGPNIKKMQVNKDFIKLYEILRGTNKNDRLTALTALEELSNPESFHIIFLLYANDDRKVNLYSNDNDQEIKEKCNRILIKLLNQNSLNFLIESIGSLDNLSSKAAYELINEKYLQSDSNSIQKIDKKSISRLIDYMEYSYNKDGIEIATKLLRRYIETSKYLDISDIDPHSISKLIDYLGSENELILDTSIRIMRIIGSQDISFLVKILNYSEMTGRGDASDVRRNRIAEIIAEIDKNKILEIITIGATLNEKSDYGLTLGTLSAINSLKSIQGLNIVDYLIPCLNSTKNRIRWIAGKIIAEVAFDEFIKPKIQEKLSIEDINALTSSLPTAKVQDWLLKTDDKERKYAMLLSLGNYDRISELNRLPFLEQEILNTILAKFDNFWDYNVANLFIKYFPEMSLSKDYLIKMSTAMDNNISTIDKQNDVIAEFIENKSLLTSNLLQIIAKKPDTNVTEYYQDGDVKGKYSYSFENQHKAASEELAKRENPPFDVKNYL